MLPYLDLQGFKLRSVMPDSDVQALETKYPGWILQNLFSWTSRLNAQLRKRYGDTPSGAAALPLGQRAPTLIGSGSAPPALALLGRPVLGSSIVLVQVTAPGPLGTALIRWSPDNGVTWNAATSAAAVVLGETGLTLSMQIGQYGIDNVYAAAPAVPETVLQWLAILTTWDAYQKRGRNPQDPMILDLKEDRARVLAEVKEAADSKDGLYDLPASEDADTAIQSGSPLGYSEPGPYRWIDVQARQITGFGGCGNGGPCV